MHKPSGDILEEPKDVAAVYTKTNPKVPYDWKSQAPEVIEAPKPVPEYQVKGNKEMRQDKRREEKEKKAKQELVEQERAAMELEARKADVGRSPVTVIDALGTIPRSVTPSPVPTDGGTLKEEAFEPCDSNLSEETPPVVPEGDTPNVSITEAKQDDAKPGISEQVDLASKPDVSEQVDLASKPDVSEQVDLASKPDVSEQVDLASKPDVSEQVDLASKPDVSEQVDLASKPDVSEQVDLASKPDVSKRVITDNELDDIKTGYGDSTGSEREDEGPTESDIELEKAEKAKAQRKHDEKISPGPLPTRGQKERAGSRGAKPAVKKGNGGRVPTGNWRDVSSTQAVSQGNGGGQASRGDSGNRGGQAGRGNRGVQAGRGDRGGQAGRGNQDNRGGQAKRGTRGGQASEDNRGSRGAPRGRARGDHFGIGNGLFNFGRGDPTPTSTPAPPPPPPKESKNPFASLGDTEV